MSFPVSFPKITTIDAIFIIAMPFLLSALAVSGAILIANVKDVADPEALALVTENLTVDWLPRLVHKTATTILFAMIYFRIGVALFCGHYATGAKTVWIGWCASLMLVMLVAITGQKASPALAQYWVATIAIGIAEKFPGCGYRCEDWSFLNFYSSTAAARTHYFIAAFAVLSIGAAALRQLSAVRKRLLGISRFEFILAMVGVASICSFVVIMLALPAPYINPESLLPATTLRTPTQIIPDWFLSPWLMIAATMPAKYLSGPAWLLAMAIPLPLTLFALAPRSRSFRVVIGAATIVLFCAFQELSFYARSGIGAAPRSVTMALTFCYFAYFLVVAPLINGLDAFFCRRKNSTSLPESEQGSRS